ncbi:MAG TPA: hypothetical protein PL124_01775 [Candidatus Cloacimonadota bacterium]|nr:hypothetical protein [Candidatus Cloacimonadota bacterium]HPS38121.1 hypothetical protein [Candidatus Cloacimonadota bacterium]
MKKALMITGALLLCALMLVSVDSGTSARVTAGKIQNFSATDMPNDDGAGVVLKWTPLHKSNRVIQYNIYRGVSPDSLFFLTGIEVDPKLGVMSSELFYYDRGDQPMIEFESAPTKLKKEKQQGANSPFYQRCPQNAAVLGSLMDRYSFAGLISNSHLYKHDRKIKKDDQTIGGYKLFQFETIYAFPKAGTKYYYSVMAVNEKGKFLPPADIQPVIPQDNRPESSARVYSSYLKDTNKLNFEWTPPLSGSDIAQWDGWLLPKSAIDLYKQEEAANAKAPDSVFSASWQNLAIQVFQEPVYATQPFYYHTVDLAQAGLNLPANLQDYVPVLSYIDRGYNQSSSLGHELRIATSKDLPSIPKFKIEDKKNDKGDYLVVAFGKPIAYVTQAIYINEAKTKLRMNYEISKNDSYQIERINFALHDAKGNDLGTVTEHFVDHIVTLKLPKGYNNIQDLKIDITLKVKGEKEIGKDLTQQHIVYDKKNKRFAGTKIIHNGEVINELFYDIYTKSKTSPMYLPGLRSSAIVRIYDHAVPLEEKTFQGISGYDKATDRLLIDPVVSVIADDKGSSGLTIPIYRDVFNKQLADLRKEIKTRQDQAKTFGAAVPDSISQPLAQATADLKFIESNPTYQKSLKAKTEKEWRNIFLKEFYKNSQSYSYQLMVTDGNAMLNLSEPFKDAKGDLYMHPKSEWFDSSKTITLFAMILLMALVIYGINLTRKKEVYIRPIAGLQEIDNAIGRATEMGRPVMFVPGWGTLGDVCTIASMMILNQIAKKTAEFDIRLINPHCDYFVMPVAQEMVQSAYSEVGRPDAFNQGDIFFISDNQFPFCAGVNGITIRERVATVFYMGFFNAEALLLTETGNQAGAIQIAATDAVTQVPFFITTCDYTLIGEEFYAASAYLSRNAELVSMLKAQDYFKLVIVIVVLIGTILSTFNFNGLINAFPIE